VWVFSALVALGVAGWVAPAAAVDPQPNAPGAQPSGVALPDPHIVTTANGYVAFGTNARPSDLQNVPIMISSDLVNWVPAGDALPVLPVWAAHGATWSPSVHATATIDTLYFTARDRGTGRQCIGSATASRVTGPYHAAAAPLVCQADLGGDIDPEVFTTSAGASWLLWKNDGNCCDQTVSIWAQPLGIFGQLTGTPTQLLSAAEPWEHGVIENPSVVEHGGVFILIYSAGQWNSSNYATGSAVCIRLDRPCLRLGTGRPTLAPVTGTAGDGGDSFFVDRSGVLRVAFHAWSAGRVGTARGSRTMWTAAIGWFGQVPVITGAAQLAVAGLPLPVTTTAPVTTTVPVATTGRASATVHATTTVPDATPVVIGRVTMTRVSSTRSEGGGYPAGPALCVVAGAGLLVRILKRSRRHAVSGPVVRATTQP
jgi:hypothetical protein